MALVKIIEINVNGGFMKYMMIVGAMIVASMNGCFAMKYHTEIQESDYNNLMTRDEESLVERRADYYPYPYFEVLVEAIYNKDEKAALAFIAVMMQEQLNQQDYVGRTPLMIAIEQGQEAIALALVEAMNSGGLLISQDEGGCALSFACGYKMDAVVDAINLKLHNTIPVVENSNNVDVSRGYRPGYRPALDPTPDADSKSPEDPNQRRFERYPHFKALLDAIDKHDTQAALELISVMTQEELNVDDCVRCTALMYAIMAQQEAIALALVEAMNQEGLLLSDMECVSTLSYAYHYGMKNVAQAIEQKINIISEK